MSYRKVRAGEQPPRRRAAGRAAPGSTPWQAMPPTWLRGCLSGDQKQGPVAHKTPEIILPQVARMSCLRWLADLKL